MRRAIRRVLSDPLTHFAALGSAAFVVHTLWGAPAANEIRVSSDVVRALEAEFSTRAGRAATDAEREALIGAEVRSEVLVREARALGLDAIDPIVRRRLVQRMRFVLEDAVAIEPPSDEALAELLEADRQRYARSPRRGFTHVFIASNHEDAAERREELVARLRAGADPAGLGDAFAHGSRFVSRADSRLERLFGPQFVAAVTLAPPGEWTPIDSAFGLHVVLVDELAPAPEATVASERKRLTARWRADQTARAVDEAITALTDRYDVRVGG